MRLQRRITTADWRRTRYSSRRLVVGAKSGKQYSAATLSAFGENLTYHSPTPTSHSNSFFTGKPAVAGLGHAFLMRNYRAGLTKRQTADPMGYPDGWNQLAYCGNGVTDAVDLWGAVSLNLIPDTQMVLKSRVRQYNPTGVYSVAVHGNSKGVVGYSVSQLASVIRTAKDEVVEEWETPLGDSHKWDGSSPIWLLSCEVGLSTYAQELANILRVPVYAATAVIRVTKELKIEIFPYLKDGEGNVQYDPKTGAEILDRQRPGKMKRFDPE